MERRELKLFGISSVVAALLTFWLDGHSLGYVLVHVSEWFGFLIVSIIVVGAFMGG